MRPHTHYNNPHALKKRKKTFKWARPTYISDTDRVPTVVLQQWYLTDTDALYIQKSVEPFWLLRPNLIWSEHIYIHAAFQLKAFLTTSLFPVAVVQLLVFPERCAWKWRTRSGISITYGILLLFQHYFKKEPGGLIPRVILIILFPCSRQYVKYLNNNTTVSDRPHFVPFAFNVPCLFSYTLFAANSAHFCFSIERTGM